MPFKWVQAAVVFGGCVVLAVLDWVLYRSLTVVVAVIVGTVSGLIVRGVRWLRRRAKE